MTKLAFGCGHLDYHSKGYKNIDIRSFPHVDCIVDISGKLPWKDNTIDEILAESILEHFPHGICSGFTYGVSHLNTIKILLEWYRILKPGGRCIIKVPNLKGIINHYIKGKISYYEFYLYIYGGQHYKENIHYSGFDPFTLKEVMKVAGFRDIVLRNCHDLNLPLDELNAWEMTGVGIK